MAKNILDWATESLYKKKSVHPFKDSRGAAAHSVTVRLTGCAFDPHSKRWNIYLNLYFHFLALVSRQSAVLNSATQHAMPLESGRKWGTECFNTRFLLPTLLCAWYSVKLIYFIYVYIFFFWELRYHSTAIDIYIT